MKIKVNDKQFNSKMIYHKNDDYYVIKILNKNGTMGYLTFKIKHESYANIIWLNKIETYKKFAHQGVGTALIQLLEYFAYKNNINYIEGKFYPDNEYAKPFYEKYGYKIEKEYYETFVSKRLEFDKIKKEIEPNLIKDITKVNQQTIEK